MVHHFKGPLDARSSDLVREFGRVLQTHGFGGNAVPAALGTPLLSGQFHLRKDLPYYLRRLAADTPINTLVKLFVLDQRIPRCAVDRAVAPLRTDDLVRLGAVATRGDEVRAAVRISGYSGLLIAHDRYDESLGKLHHDHVLDVNPTTTTLASLTVRRQVWRALDVGTGCGVLALAAARHSAQVIGVDTNPRALNFAVFNAGLNGFEHVEFRQGSLFEPVAGERFDLIVCNPPYVISPESRYIFRDGGRRGDGLCEEVVRRTPVHLEEGGFASILCNWGIASAETWSAPLGRWVAQSGCDSWLLCSSEADPLAYAAMWNRSADRAAYAEALDRWTAYCAELGIAAIGMGAVILRRRTAPSNWMRADRLPDGGIGPSDAPIERFFQSEDHLSTLREDDALLQQAFCAAPDHRLQQTLAVQDGAYVIDHASVQLQSGLQFRGAVDAYTTRLLALCDGRRTLNQIASTLAHDGGDRDRLRVACAAIARRLVSSGFLVPAASSTR